MEVNGIGEATFEQIKDRITFTSEKGIMKAEIVLTVSESKRLIAKGVAARILSR